MLSFDLVDPPDFQNYCQQVAAALSPYFWSPLLLNEVLQFILHGKPEIVVECELNCFGPSKALKTFKHTDLLVSVGEIGVELWELSYFRRIKYFEIEHMYLCAAIFSDEKTVVVANETLDFYDIATEKKLRQIPCQQKIRILTLTEDEKILAGASFGRNIDFWNVQSGKLIRTLDSSAACADILFSLDDTTLHIVHHGDILQMNAATGEVTPLYSDNDGEVTAIQEFPGPLLLTANHKRDRYKRNQRWTEVTLWDLTTYRRTWAKPHGAKVISVCDMGTSVVSGGERETVRLWDLETGDLLTQYDGGRQRAFKRFALTPDRRRLVAATNAGIIVIFNLS